MTDGVWMSGEVCGIVGTYCSRCCKGVAEKRFISGDIFPDCEFCAKKVKWLRSNSEASWINTHETTAGNE